VIEPNHPVVVRGQKATHQQTKAHNSRLVLRTIYDRREISRAEIARQTGLSRTTVSDVVADLLSQGLVEEFGFGLSNGGKTPILLRLISNARCLIGVDLSGDEFRGEVVNLRGEMQHAVGLPLEGRSGPDALELVYALLDQLVPTANAPLLGLGIGTPGLVDVERGSQVNWSVNLDWLDFPLRDLIQRRYQLPAFVLNDCQASALAEHVFGDHHDSANLVVIKAEHGLGSGLILNGQLFHGDLFGAGEIGHVVVEHEGLPCRCGNRGCLETVASASAILNRIQAATALTPGSALHHSARNGTALTVRMARQALDADDSAVRDAVHQAGRGLGIAIANLVGALNVRYVVIAGSIVGLGPELLNVIRQEMLARSLTALARETHIDYSALGPRITILGASAVLLQEELGVTPFR
jgi:N-acetylglucosamine repressor